jgi:hypothetical protein
MTGKFLHVAFSLTAKRSIPSDQIQGVLNWAKDWVRYAPNCYILYTHTDVDIWFDRLQKILNENDTIFIVEINIENRQGWVPKSVWEWIRKDRPSE